MYDNTAIRKAFNDFLKVLKEKSVVSPVKKFSTRRYNKKVKHMGTSKHDETQNASSKTSSKTSSKKKK